MTIRLYTFRFSPPARLAKLAAAICGLQPEYIEVDISKAEQFSPEFVAVNPKHLVPVLEEDGVYIEESMDIVRHIFNKYNKNPNNDHWYPKDPIKRAEVDEWLDWAQKGRGDWKTALHLTIRTTVVLSHMACQQGMGWVDHYGVLTRLAGIKARRDKVALADLKRQLAVAEEIFEKRKITKVEDLNIGDMGVFLEITVVMECLAGYYWSNYPALENLLKVSKQIPEFMEIHQPFLDFCREYRHHRDANTTASLLTTISQVITTFVTFAKIVMVDPVNFVKEMFVRPPLEDKTSQ